jgi:hypothetical protein
MQISSHHASFLDKLSQVLGAISSELEILGTHAQILHSAHERGRQTNSPTTARLMEALSHVYMDLVDFCKQVRGLLGGTSEYSIRTRLIHIS